MLMPYRYVFLVARARKAAMQGDAYAGTLRDAKAGKIGRFTDPASVPGQVSQHQAVDSKQ